MASSASGGRAVEVALGASSTSTPMGVQQRIGRRRNHTIQRAQERAGSSIETYCSISPSSRAHASSLRSWRRLMLE
jgi:hypothetical protein